MKLSIILPVYNAEKYISEAIYSFYNQLMPGVELIIVNDGSTDTSLKIINEVLAFLNHPVCIKLYSQENKGVSVARNNAINYSKGSYIAFLDADDFITENYLYEVLNVIDNVSPDIIEFGFFSFKNSKEKKDRTPIFVHDKFGLSNTSEVIDDVFARSVWYPTIRVTKSFLVKSEPFPEGVRFCEDLMVQSKIYEKAKDTYLIDKALYAYRINPEGATLNIKPDYFENIVDYYKNLPKANFKHLDYMKINLAYVLYKCSDGKRFNLKMRLEFLLLFTKYFFDKKIINRKKVILLSPKFYELLRFLKGKYENRI